FVGRQVAGAERNRHAKYAALPLPALDGERPAMQLGQFLHQSETDSASLKGPAECPLDAMETLEQARQFMGRDTGAGIAHRKLDALVAGGTQRNRDRAREGELERV